MRRSLVFMSPLILTLACFGLTGCAESDSDAATITETSSAVAEKAAEDAVETPSTDSKAATTDVAAETGEAAATSEETTAEATLKTESDVALTENDSQAPAETKADNITKDETDAAKPADEEQASTIGPQLPDSLKWLTDWKSRDFDWLGDWKSALDEIRRPLVLRPETPWPAEDADTDATPPTEAEAGKDEFAQAAGAPRPESKPEDSEELAADEE